MNEPVMPLGRLPRFVQWSLLLAGSVAFATALKAAGLPGALMLGPMMAAIALECAGGMIRVPRSADTTAQAIIGTKFAGAISGSIAGTFFHQWPLLIGVALSTLLASSALGWLMSRLRVLPGSTAVWGLSPGAASVMMLMAEAFGADAQLVAFMQYLRVVLVAITASVFARFWVHHLGAAPETVWFPPIHWVPFAETLAVAVVGALLGQRLRLPAGLLLGPMILGAILHANGLVEIELPKWLLVIGYALLGWRIGLRFSPRIMAQAFRALPQILVSIFVLIAFCGGVAAILVKTLHIDPLTAYFATSPGGMDSAAIVAASSNVDLGLVMAFQTSRLVVLLALGPALARFVARRLPGSPGEEAAPAVETESEREEAEELVQKVD